MLFIVVGILPVVYLAVRMVAHRHRPRPGMLETAAAAVPLVRPQGSAG